MESVRGLNMEADDMQVVLSALKGVSKRIKEVAQTHKPLFGGEHFLTGKEMCERLYISPRTLQDYRDRRILPYTQFAGKILYKASDLERLLENNYKNSKLSQKLIEYRHNVGLSSINAKQQKLLKYTSTMATIKELYQLSMRQSYNACIMQSFL